MPRDAAPPLARRGPRRVGVRTAWAILALVVFAGFVALGIWQIERRSWKHALIERVEQRVHAEAQTAPGSAQWPRLNAADDEYRRVRLSGVYLHERETLVQAATAMGAGFWVLTPLLQADGSTVLVNRGFVPPSLRLHEGRRGSEPAGSITVTGLLRLTEPTGGFLRRNDPARGRWYSRDVQAIALAQGLTRAAPYFVDADAAEAMRPPGAASANGELPVAGLTVISFADNHLVYALTWWAMAAMVAGAAAHVWRDDRRSRAAAEPETNHPAGRSHDAVHPA